MLFELPSFEHVDAREVKEVASLLRKYGGRARVIAGATDLLGLISSSWHPSAAVVVGARANYLLGAR